MACSFLYSTFLKCYHYHKSYEIEVEVYNISGGTRVSTAMYRRWYTAACICIMQYQLSMISSTFQQSLMFSHDKFNISLKYLNYASKNAFIHINSPMYYCLKPHHQYPPPPGINDVPCTDIRDTPRQTSDTTIFFIYLNHNPLQNLKKRLYTHYPVSKILHFLPKPLTSSQLELPCCNI